MASDDSTVYCEECEAEITTATPMWDKFLGVCTRCYAVAKAAELTGHPLAAVVDVLVQAADDASEAETDDGEEGAGDSSGDDSNDADMPADDAEPASHAGGPQAGNAWYDSWEGRWEFFSDQRDRFKGIGMSQR